MMQSAPNALFCFIYLIYANFSDASLIIRIALISCLNATLMQIVSNDRKIFKPVIYIIFVAMEYYITTKKMILILILTTPMEKTKTTTIIII